MLIERGSSVTRIADWEHAGVVYYLHMGSGPRITGHLTILALGPAATYRSVVVAPHAARQALTMLLEAPDAAARSGTAECLLAMRGALIH
jgi:hypothetical protein